ncbi:MAG: amino acid transporter substrate-binding protein [Rhizobacter sp.]|nr:amino acid transporter substrate-binding protein [Rhizobacter sp.]
MIGRLASLALGVAFVASAAAQQGVTKDEIVIGTVQDLSGPISVIGTYVRQGMEAQVDAVNAAGGINGRKLRLVVEDSGYDPRKAITATRKLLGQDKVFAIVGTLGSSIVKVTMPVSLEAGVPFLFPGAPIDDVYEPPKKLAFAYNGTYTRQFTSATQYAWDKMNKRRVCLFAQDDETGEQVEKGIAAGLKAQKATLTEKVTFKRGATDFSSQIAKLKAANCDIVMVGATVRDAANAAAERQKQGWDVTMMVGQAAALTPFVALAGPGGEGVYGINLWPPLHELRGRPQIAKIIEAYEKKNSKPFDDLVLTGHEMVALFSEGAKRAGPELTPDTLVKGLESLKDFDPGFGFWPMTFTPTQRLGSASTVLTQVKGGKWVSVGQLN